LALPKDNARAPRGEQIAADLERLTRLLRAAEHGNGLNPAQREAIRYLARANRFSNSPAALARYLGATKGTISQTVKSLVQKGYLAKAERQGERRSIALHLTDKGAAALSSDPWTALTGTVAYLKPRTQRRLARGLHRLLTEEIQRHGHVSFGTCATCRHFAKGNEASPHSCRLFDEALTSTDTQLICAAFDPGHAGPDNR
jgi:DNA-binding MarR family transcriptional regulator